MMSCFLYNNGREVSTMSAERLFKIVNRLIDKNTCTAKELADELEVSLRTIYRDIDTLTLSGIPVITTQGKGGGITLLDHHILNKTFLTSYEQDQIIMALQSIQNTSISSSELILKLKNLFRRETNNWIEVDCKEWGTNDRSFEVLRDAILSKHIIEISYWGTSGKQTKRKIKPAKLVFKSKSWYLQGYCLMRKDYRTFKLARIEHIETLNEIFDDELTPPKFGDIEPSQLTEIHLEFEPCVKNRIIEDFKESQITYHEDKIEVVTYIPVDNWVKEYILSYGAAVKVIEPISLKEDVEKEIRKMLEKINN